MTKGYVERSIIRVLADREFSESNDTDDEFPPRSVSITEIIEYLADKTDSLPRSRAASIRRAFRQLEDKGFIERAGRHERRQYWQLTVEGKEEAKILKHEYQKEIGKIERRYGGEWTSKILQ